MVPSTLDKKIDSNAFNGMWFLFKEVNSCSELTTVKYNRHLHEE